MPAPKILADYRQLEEISKTFNQHADEIATQLQRIKQGVDKLEGGDWQGVGAELFLNEMNDDVMPAINRLRNALLIAGQESNRIAQQFIQAEDDAAKLLLMNGANGKSGNFDVNPSNNTPKAGPANGVLDIKPNNNGGGGTTPQPNATDQLRQGLEQQYHIKISKGNKEWSKEDLEDLQRALGRLNERERQKVAGVTFDRWDTPDSYRKAHPGSTISDTTGGVTNADSDGKVHSISMLDQGFDHPRVQNGVKVLPQTKHGVVLGEYSLLHELGHAHEFSDPSESVLKGFQKAMGNKPPMTDYAKTNSHESFAEAYAIYKADPGFVQKNYPEVYKFFQNNEHLKTSKK
jgi:WXG100 family type VII secretion target